MPVSKADCNRYKREDLEEKRDKPGQSRALPIGPFYASEESPDAKLFGTRCANDGDGKSVRCCCQTLWTKLSRIKTRECPAASLPQPISDRRINGRPCPRSFHKGKPHYQNHVENASPVLCAEHGCGTAPQVGSLLGHKHPRP